MARKDKNGKGLARWSQRWDLCKGADSCEKQINLTADTERRK